jgi:hypothetical protein
MPAYLNVLQLMAVWYFRAHLVLPVTKKHKLTCCSVSAKRAILCLYWLAAGASWVLPRCCTVYRDETLSKTWVFAEHKMTQHIQQGQRQDTFNYNIRQQTGNFVIDHPAFGSGQVSWHVRRHTENELVIASYGNFTHLTAGECNVAMARN